MVHYFGDAGFPGTVSAAVEGAVGLHPVSDDPAFTVSAGGGQLVDGALETVESVGPSCGHYLEGTLVVIAAHIAPSHGNLLVQGIRREAARATPVDVASGCSVRKPRP